MKKKIIIVLFLFICSISLCSCSFLFGKASLEYEYDEEESIEIKSLMSDVEEYLKSGDKYNEFYDAYCDINMFAYKIITFYKKENIKYSMDGNSESPLRMEKFYSLFMDIVEWQNDILISTYNSPYKDKFFEGWTEKQIQSIFDSDYPSEYYTFSEEENKLTTEFQAFSIDEVLANASEYLIRLIKLRNNMASVATSTNYKDFAYPNIYGRDYTCESANTFSTYVKQKLVPIAYDLNSEIKQLKSTLTSEEIKELDDELLANSIDNMQIVEEYINNIGGSFNYEYNYLLNRGHFYYSNHENALQGAYTTYLYWDGLPGVYFGPGYQNTFTFVHEYGHYYSATRINGLTSSMDLAETQSQSNEMLFLAYIMNNSDYSDAQKQYLESSQLLSALCNIIMCSIINEFEINVYTTKDELSLEYFDQACKDICQSYGGYDKIVEELAMNPVKYWKIVCVDNPFYYISYAMSLIPSIGIYEMAMNDFDNAKDCYLKLCESGDLDFLEALSNAGLYNPFNEEVYNNLAELLG